MTDCLFCKIVNGDIPAEKVYETDDIIAFKDILPQAPLHCLIIPRKHIETLNDITEADHELIGKIYAVAKKIVTEAGFAQEGYRVVSNCNKAAGQTVFHIHFHVLAGRELKWPPG